MRPTNIRYEYRKYTEFNLTKRNVELQKSLHNYCKIVSPICELFETPLWV